MANETNKSPYSNVKGYRARPPLNMSNHMRSPMSAPNAGVSGFKVRSQANVTKAKVGIPGGRGTVAPASQ